MRPDLENRQDIEELVNRFYDKIRSNELLGPIFNESIQSHWEEHLTTMYSFWSTLLLNENSYRGNPMLKHIALTQKVNLEDNHFAEWLKIFDLTVNELFIGLKAEEAKKRAHHIATTMKLKLLKNESFRL